MQHNSRSENLTFGFVFMVTLLCFGFFFLLIYLDSAGKISQNISDIKIAVIGFANLTIGFICGSSIQSMNKKPTGQTTQNNESSTVINNPEPDTTKNP